MTKEDKPALRLDRRAQDALIEALSEGGKFRRLVEFRNARQELWDLQFRRNSGASSLVSLYGGLTSVLDLHVRAGKGSAKPEFRYQIQHATHQIAARALGDSSAWQAWQSATDLAKAWSDVKPYLHDRERWLMRGEGARHYIEGRVHALLCSEFVSSISVIDREAATSFRDATTRRNIIGAIREAIDAQLASVPDRPKWLKSKNFDASPDLLGVDRKGRLLVIEAKPPEYRTGIENGPVQVAMYAGLIATWLRQDPKAPSLLQAMLRQRVDVGLSRRLKPAVTFSSDMLVVPVLAIGIGSVPESVMGRSRAFQAALDGFRPAPELSLEPIEIWRLQASQMKT